MTVVNAPSLCPPSLQVVKEAEKKILERELSGAENKEYLAMEGLPAFNKARGSGARDPPPGGPKPSGYCLTPWPPAAIPRRRQLERAASAATAWARSSRKAPPPWGLPRFPFLKRSQPARASQ